MNSELATLPVTAPNVRPRGTTLGRYILLERLGVGGMGVVYAAYDPELDRKVAVKILHDRASPERQQRLTREAQAMARLSHPNVMVVHDVGVADGEVFVAMELVAGENLSAWRASPRTWREVVQIFLAAGQGLAAAHHAGLVHRDFKPDNVLLRAADRHVLVSDFGLARLAPDAPVEVDEPHEVSSSLDHALTHAGALLGTPAYMAPEQHRGEPADARSDQFAFCVALYEALYEERPFAAADGSGLDSLDALALEVVKGNVRPAPRASRVPSWLRKVVVRGLASAPGDRWPTMDALLAALRRDPARTLRGWLIGGGVASAIVAVLVLRGSAVGTPACDGAAARVAAVWSAPVKAANAAAFAATGRPYAATTWQLTEHALDDYAAHWAAMHTEACEATEVRHEQSQELLDLRMGCLDRRLNALGAIAAAFGGKIDDTLLQKSVNAANALPPIASCGDAAALRALVPLPDDPVLRTRIDVLERGLAQVTASDNVGKIEQAVTALAPLLAEARAIGYPVALADALYERMHLFQVKHDPDAEAAAREALAALAAAHEDDRLASAVSALGHALQIAARTNEALALVPIAEALLVRSGNSAATRVAIANDHALLLQTAGRLPEAEAVARGAVELQTQIGPREGELASVCLNLASILVDEAKYAEARVVLDRALAIMRSAYGPEVPNVAVLENTLGRNLLAQHDPAAAEGFFRDAVRIGELSAPGSDVVSATTMNLGLALREQGKVAEANAAFQHSLEVRIKRSGPDHPSVGTVYHNLSVFAQQDGDPKKSLEYAQRALAIKEKALGPDHPEIATSLDSAGLALLALNRPAEAKPLFERALAINEKALPADHPNVAGVRLSLAKSFLDLHQPATAIPLIEKALASIDRKDPQDLLRAEGRLTLAKALWEQGDHGRSHTKAEEARALYVQYAVTADDKNGLIRLDEWLRKHQI